MGGALPRPHAIRIVAPLPMSTRLSSRRETLARRREGTEMVWQAPTFVELRMDAEIGSYQDEFAPEEVPAFATREDDEE